MILSTILFSPLVGALMLLLMPRQQTVGIRRAAFIFSLIPFASLAAPASRLRSRRGRLPVRRAARGSPASASIYHLGVDGISLFLVLLTTFLTPLVILSVGATSSTG